MKKNISILILFVFIHALLLSQPWQQDDGMFNSSGVPSVSFSQPRFADLDGDGDKDIILGSIDDGLIYIENMYPEFAPGFEIFTGISHLDAEMGVCADLDNDGDLDLITGGYTGLNYFENIGTVLMPVFQKVNNFFPDLSVGQNPIPYLADVDDDNDYDMVVGFSENGGVKIYYNSGTPSLAQFSELNTLTIGDVGLYAYPVFSDLDNDGDQDIVIGRDTHGFVYYNNIGTPQNGNWIIDDTVFSGLGNDSYWNSPDLIDINEDGTFDLIYGTAEGPLQYYENIGTQTTPSWQLNTTLFGGVLDVGGASSPFFYDFDGDGDFDLVSGSQLGDIKYYENVSTPYAIVWEEDNSYFASIDHSIYSAITLGDVYNNGYADAIVGDLSGNLFFHRNTGFGFMYESGVLASVALGGWSVPRLVDMDNDNDLDIVAGNENGNLFYFENQGTPSVPVWVEIVGYFGSIDVGSDCSPTIGDLTLNGNLDIVTGDISGELQFFENIEGNWTENPYPVSGLSGGQNTAPALIDLDGDGDLDLTLGNYGGTFNYYENQHIIVGTDPEEPQAQKILLRNYPNPFRGMTTISYFTTENTSLRSTSPRQAQDTEIRIYNVKGQLVRQLHVNDSDHSYSIEVSWNGKDNEGNIVNPGLYLYELQIDGSRVDVGKCIFLK